MSCGDCDRLPDCGACGADVRSIVCLGDKPLANALLANEDDHVERYPLHVVQCVSCSAVQLTHQVAPATLFGGYPYYSSQSLTMIDSAAQLANRLIDAHKLDRRQLVVEIGSNDGYLLAHYANRGVRVLGIDPADGPADVADARGVRTLRLFFDADIGRMFVGEADIVHANNVLAHVPNPASVIEGVAAMLRPGGLLVIETPWLSALVEHCEFDTIYHEHRWYWSLTALQPLLHAHGLQIVDVELLDLHGGSLRIYASRVNSRTVVSRFADCPEVDLDERLAGFDQLVAHRLSVLGDWWSLLAEQGEIAGYGAAAKATMLCCAAGLTPSFVVDSTPAKQQRWMPGVGAQIVSPEQLVEQRPPNCVIFAWNFAKEIAAKARSYTDSGGALWVPLPMPHRVGRAHAPAS